MPISTSISIMRNCVATIWSVLLECVPYWGALFLFLIMLKFDIVQISNIMKLKKG